MKTSTAPTLAAVVAVLLLPVAGAGAAEVPGTTCRVFPASNVWNMDVRGLPVHAKNVAWKRATHAGTTRLHPDFGPPDFGIPFDVVTSEHDDVSIDFLYADESDPGPYPFGPDIRIEGGSDRHAIMVDADACTLHELFAARWNGGAPAAGSGDLPPRLERPPPGPAGPAPTPPGCRSSPAWSGTTRCSDRSRGSTTRSGSRSRARPGPTSGPRDIRPAWTIRGARRWAHGFRLRRSFHVGGYSPTARIVLRAMKRHGLIVADNGSDWFFQGSVDPRWTYAFVDELKRIPAKAFDAIDVSACRVAKRSAAFAYGPGCPAP